jgi:hypothetical protein
MKILVLSRLRLKQKNRAGAMANEYGVATI